MYRSLCALHTFCVQVDAFTAVPFKGNPAAVVLLDSQTGPAVTPEIRQKIAAEMNLAETAFVENKESSSSGATFQTSRSVIFEALYKTLICASQMRLTECQGEKNFYQEF